MVVALTRKVGVAMVSRWIQGRACWKMELGIFDARHWDLRGRESQICLHGFGHA